MARLTHDALILLARLPAGCEHTLVRIAFEIFKGYNKDKPDTPTAAALTRATRAAEQLVGLKRASPLPKRKGMTSIYIHDQTGGSVQAQFLMNLVVRGGEDRRRDDRRSADSPHVAERRQNDRRTIEAEVRARPRRIVRAITVAEPPKPKSPFDSFKSFQPRPHSTPLPTQRADDNDDI